MKASMNNKRIFISLIVYLLIITVSSLSASELVDGVAAVVGDEIILYSEIDFNLQMYLMQMQNDNITNAQADSLRVMILEQMVNDKLVLVEAQKDTSIQITEEMIESALVERLEELKSRFNSQTEFEAQMQLEGLSMRELKAKFRRETRNQLIKERFISKFLSKVSITSKEIRRFYKDYSDSLPSQPEAIKVAHILFEIKPSQATLDTALAKANKIKEMLDEGGDFIALAQIYSEDGTASSGGDLGYFSKGTLFAEFEDIVFSMKAGEISDPFKTRLGYHIVKVEDKLPENVRARHILFKTKPTDADINEIKLLADSVTQSITDSIIDFPEAVKQFSTDEESRKQAGELGWFAVDQLTPEFKRSLQDLETGKLSEPTESEFGIHILKVLDHQKSRQFSIDEDWDKLKEFARRQKSDQILNNWLNDARERIYVDIRL